MVAALFILLIISIPRLARVDCAGSGYGLGQAGFTPISAAGGGGGGRVEVVGSLGARQELLQRPAAPGLAGKRSGGTACERGELDSL